MEQIELFSIDKIQRCEFKRATYYLNIIEGMHPQI